MQKIKFLYNMKIQFSSPVVKHCYSLRCLPFNTPDQRIDEICVQVSPNHLMTETTDGFGNGVLTDRITTPHDEFSVLVEGIATIDHTKRSKEPLNSIYKYPSQYTRIGSRLQNFINSISTEILSLSIEQEVLEISKEIHKNFHYKSGATNISTTAEDALEIGSGVCQDYAHILIGVCRSLKIPARYVAGILSGVGESHAWVEVYSGGYWIGIDPTNLKMCDDCYLKLSHGRDFGDCGLNRGLLFGGGTQKQTILASVECI